LQRAACSRPLFYFLLKTSSSSLGDDPGLSCI
jgi:hypothetical protein